MVSNISYLWKMVVIILELTNFEVFASTPCINESSAEQLISFLQKNPVPVGFITTSSGVPVTYKDTQTINTDRLILNDFFMESMIHIARERIPERVVHAKGTGAFGKFTVTHDLSDICKAKVFDTVGKETPVVVRFSISFQSRGGSDIARDLRGFAVKFYTRQGNLDLLALNAEMFLIKDPVIFPSIVHSFQKNPATQTADFNSVWDLMTARPETLNMLMRILGDRGIPDGYRHMPGFTIHTFELTNHLGNRTFAKFHWLPELGIKNLTNTQASLIQAKELDYATKDLYNAIKNGHFPTWTLNVQTIPEDEVYKAKFDIFDVTIFWPEDLYPLRQIGVLELNKNPENQFAEIEQLAFSPGNMVPGIWGFDKVYEARVMTYREAHMHRLGVNFNKIPVNCPFRTVTRTYNRDGSPPVADNERDTPNYLFNSFNGPEPFSDDNTPPRPFVHTDPRVTNFAQAGDIYKEMPEDEKLRLLETIVVLLRCADKRIQERAVMLYKIINEDLGKRVENNLNNDKKCT